jgi:hypothetical protein
MHIVYPTFCCHHFDKCHHRITHIVKVFVSIRPACTRLLETVRPCFNLWIFTLRASVEVTLEEINTHDGEDQQEKHTNNSNITNRGY